MRAYLPKNSEPDADPFQETQELIVTYLKMKEKIYLSTLTYTKTHKNELSVGFRVLSSEFLEAEPESEVRSCYFCYRQYGIHATIYQLFAKMVTFKSYTEASVMWLLSSRRWVMILRCLTFSTKILSSSHLKKQTRRDS